jgi:hypothetical protein
MYRIDFYGRKEHSIDTTLDTEIIAPIYSHVLSSTSFCVWTCLICFDHAAYTHENLQTPTTIATLDDDFSLSKHKLRSTYQLV